MKNGRIRGPVGHLVDLPRPEDLSPQASSSAAPAAEVRASAPIPSSAHLLSLTSTVVSPPGLSPDSKGYEQAVMSLRSAAKRLSEPGQAPPQVTAMMRSVFTLISLRDTVNLQRGRGGQV